MTSALIGIGIIIFVIAFFAIMGRKGSKTNFYLQYTAEGLALVKHLEQMFENNESLNWFGEIEIFNKINNTNHIKDRSELEIAMGIQGYLDEPEGSLKYIAGDYYDTLLARINLRYSSEFNVLDAFNEGETMEKFNLNIKSNEFLHLNIERVDWYEEKTITTSINYGGFQYKIAGQGGGSYRMGNLKVMPNKKQEFQHIDRGTLYITNQRIIFVGTEKRVNKSIDIDNIIESSIFRDGILIGKSEGKKPLLIFEEYVQNSKQAPNKRDHLNRVVRVLDRVIRKNQFVEISC
jgi:hypothetical protein